MPRPIPYAVASYEEIVRGDYHFVDKTRFIRDLERYKIPVFLRPRRYGKSLWCSILECYYDVNRRERFDTLFGRTDIGRNPTTARNSHMVLRFDFSKVCLSNNLEDLEVQFNDVCCEAFKCFLKYYEKLLTEPVPLEHRSASAILNAIAGAVKRNNLPPLNIIIDEYDNFSNQLLTTRQDSLYNELTTGDSFLRAFFRTIKAGIGEDSVARVFITGVLPVTMDDLTSGFNIGQIITLKESTLSMMGFTQAEVDAYLERIFAEHTWPSSLHQRVRDDVRALYNGYRLLPDATETLYNSTMLNFYLNDLVLSNGQLPRETIDANLRVDINWLRRLTGSDESTRELLEKLQFDGTLPVDPTMLRAKFNMKQFFDPRFYPLSLYYLGMLSFRDEYSLEFPNLTMKAIFTDYFNEVEHLSVSMGYDDMFRQFLADHDIATLFAGYWKRYIGQIPAQAFDKANENFFRTTFYELCTRYLSRHLTLAIEVNHPCGRSDFEALGRPGTPFDGQAYLIEFKHFSKAEARKAKLASWKTPPTEDVAQANRYAADLQAKYPGLAVRIHLLYTVGCNSFRIF